MLLGAPASRQEPLVSPPQPARDQADIGTVEPYRRASGVRRLAVDLEPAYVALERVERRLEAFRSRLDRVAVVETTLALFLHLQITVLVAAFGAWPEGSPFLWRLGSVAYGSAGIVIIGIVVGVHRLLRNGDPRSLSRLIEDRLASGSDLLRSTMELLPRREQLVRAEGVSPALLARLAHAAEAQLANLHPEALAPLRRARRLGLVVVGLFVAAMAWDGTHEGVVRHALAHLSSRTGASRAAVSSGVTRPTLVSDLIVKLQMPAYTGLEDRQFPSDSGDLTVLRGTRVELSAMPIVRASQAYIVSRRDPSRPLPALIGPDGRITVSFVVMEPDGYAIRLVRPDGVTEDEERWRALGLSEDAPPGVEVVVPDKDLDVHVDDRVLVAATIVDDFGLSQVEVAIEREGRPAERRVMSVQAGERRVEVTEEIALQSLSPRPGERIGLVVEARDNDAISGAKIGRSERVTLRVFSPEEHHRALVDAIAALTDVLTDRLADRLECKLDNDEPIAVEDAISVQRGFNKAESDAASALSELRKRAKEDALAPASLFEDLEAAARSLHDALAEELRAIERISTDEDTFPGSRERRLTVLKKHAGRLVRELERAIVLLDALVGRERQKSMLAQVKDVARTERELMDVLKNLKQSSDPALRSEAERKLDELERSIDQMMADLARNAKGANAENFNEGALDPLGQAKDLASHKKQVSEIRDLIRKGRFDEAERLMQELQGRTREMAEAMRDDLHESETAEEHAFEQELRELTGDMARAAGEQDGVLSEGEPPATEQQRALGEHWKGKLERVVPGVVEAIKEAQDRVAPNVLKNPEVAQRPVLPRARDAIRTALDALQRLDVDGALQAMNEAQDMLAQAQAEAEMQGFDAPGAHDRRAAQQDAESIQRAMLRLGDADRALRSSIPQPRETLSPEGRGRLGRAADAQRGTRQRLSKLRERLARLAEAHPALEREAGSSLEQADQAMREAEDAMRAYRAISGAERAREARRAIEQARQAVQRASERRQVQPSPRTGDGVGYGSKRVEIAKPSPGGVPKEFREEVLRAMKEGGPERYRSQIRRYYEEILK